MSTRIYGLMQLYRKEKELYIQLEDVQNRIKELRLELGLNIFPGVK